MSKYVIDRGNTIGVAFKILEQATYRDVKQCIHFGTHVVNNYVDKNVAEHHNDHLKKLTAFSDFKTTLRRHRHGRMGDVRDVGLDLCDAEIMWSEIEANFADEKTFTTYMKIADAAIAETSKQIWHLSRRDEETQTC